MIHFHRTGPHPLLVCLALIDSARSRTLWGIRWYGKRSKRPWPLWGQVIILYIMGSKGLGQPSKNKPPTDEWFHSFHGHLLKQRLIYMLEMYAMNMKQSVNRNQNCLNPTSPLPSISKSSVTVSETNWAMFSSMAPRQVVMVKGRTALYVVDKPFLVEIAGIQHCWINHYISWS